jgi:hypothetical protein
VRRGGHSLDPIGHRTSSAGDGMVLRGVAVALWSKHESQEITIFLELASAGLVRTLWVC